MMSLSIPRCLVVVFAVTVLSFTSVHLNRHTILNSTSQRNISLSKYLVASSTEQPEVPREPTSEPVLSMDQVDESRNSGKWNTGVANSEDQGVAQTTLIPDSTGPLLPSESRDTRRVVTPGGDIHKETWGSHHTDTDPASVAHSVSMGRESGEGTPVLHSDSENLTEVWNMIDTYLETDGKAGLDQINDDATLFHLNDDNCPLRYNTVFRSSSGMILGILWKPKHLSWVRFTATHAWQLLQYCQWTISVPNGLYVSAVVRLGQTFCRYGAHIFMKATYEGKYEVHECSTSYSSGEYFLTFTSTNKLSYALYFNIELHNTPSMPVLLDFRLMFFSTRVPLTKRLKVVASSLVSGYVTTPGYPLALTPRNMNASYIILLPKHWSTLLSFPRCCLYSKNQGHGELTLSEHHHNGNVSILWKKYGKQLIPTTLYNNSIGITLKPEHITYRGFKLLFSLHPHHALPHKLSTGLFNCSVPHYASFRQHLHCNLEKECEGGEDEGGHCPFSSPACEGRVSVAGVKCYSLHTSEEPLSWADAQGQCQHKGGQLATWRSQQEEDAFLKMFRVVKKRSHSYVGLIIDNSVPNLYRLTWRWVDNTIAYNAPAVDPFFNNPSKEKPWQHKFRTYYVIRYFDDNLALNAILSNDASLFSYVCEQSVKSHSSIHKDEQRFQSQQLGMTHGLATAAAHPWNKGMSSFTECPHGYWTHDFLACGTQVVCLANQAMLKCPLSTWSTGPSGREHGATDTSILADSVAMFTCDNLAQTLHYTLVCDFAPDCWDASDESFCQLRECDEEEYQCDSGQCINIRGSIRDMKCDRISDCYDHSDETECSVREFADALYKPFPVRPPGRIDYTSTYEMTVTKLEDPDKCPETHFSCPGDAGYCLPIYVRCNDYYDCPQHEDEADCSSYYCPGFYRCRGTRSCVHVEQMCDGIEQCPEKDDEMMCDSSCPLDCQCQGWAAVCRHPFPAHSFSQFRYLDASHSLMKFTYFDNSSSVYLIWLSLKSCELRSVSTPGFVNLQMLDVSNNLIDSLAVESMLLLPNLKEIILSNNPLVSISTDDMIKNHIILNRVELASTSLTLFDCSVFASYPEITFLNISHSKAMTITKRLSSCFPFLRELDIRGTDTAQTPLSLYDGLQHIEFIFSDNYRLCCSSILPKVPHKIFCLAPSSGYSSCSDLLRSSFHRAVLWIMIIASFLGIVGSVIAKYLLSDVSVPSPSTDILLYNLAVVDFFMSTYMCIVASADLHFRGDFLFHERDWVTSAGCQAAEYLVLAASEVSCFTMLLLSLDRLLAVRFHSSRFHFKSSSVACLISWCIAMCVASIPWLLAGSSGNVYDNTALCVPMPTVESSLHGHAYSFGVLVVLNSVMSVVTLVCQVIVYSHVRGSDVSLMTGQDPKAVVLARRVMTLVISHVIFWLTVGVLGVVSSLDAASSNADVIVSMAALVMPVKPVLDPMLYAYALMAERHTLEEQSRLLNLLKVRVQSQTVKPSTTKSVTSHTNRSSEINQAESRAIGANKPRETNQAVSDSDTFIQSFGRDTDVLKFLRQCLQTNTLQLQDIRKVLVHYEQNA